MSELITMAKDGETSLVHPESVDSHKKAGWVVLHERGLAKCTTTMDTSSIKTALDESCTRIADLEAEIRCLAKDAVIEGETLRSRISELEAQLAEALGSGDESTDKAILVARAAELGIGNQSTLARWGVKRLAESIAEAEKV